MIQTVDLDSLVADVTSLFLDGAEPSSVDVVIPPGFGDARIGAAILASLRAASDAPVAEITMDEIADQETFNERLAAGLERRYVRGSTGGPDMALKTLLRGDRPALYVLRRFHCTLETLPSTMLACLRTAEEDGHARGVVLTPASLRRLKKRWERRGHPLVASNYGDFHDRRVVPLFDARTLASQPIDGVPLHIAKFVLATTGGYPDALRRVLGVWRRGGKSLKLDRELRQRLQQEACVDLVRFVEWLDDEGTFFLDRVVDVHHGFASEDALDSLRMHELRDLLLQGDELRAAALGHAALASQREALLRHGDPGGRLRAHEQARRLYLRGDYSAALQLLPADTPRVGAAIELLRLHAAIMAILTDVEPGLDTDWSALQKAIGEAQRWLGQHAAVDETGELQRRHGELARLARTIHSCADTRIVDRLATPRPEGGYDPDAVRAALFLLTLHLAGARRRRGPAEALRDGLALPEQLLRVWARWRLELDYYCAPGFDEAERETVQRLWGQKDNLLQLPAAGERFPSLWSFALCAGTRMERAAGGPPGPEPTAAELAKALQFLLARNDPAHALSTAKQALRDKYFDLCDRWLAAVYAAAPPEAGSIDRADVLRILQPLPLLDGDLLEWPTRAAAPLT